MRLRFVGSKYLTEYHGLADFEQGEEKEVPDEVGNLLLKKFPNLFELVEPVSAVNPADAGATELADSERCTAVLKKTGKRCTGVVFKAGYCKFHYRLLKRLGQIK